MSLQQSSNEELLNIATKIAISASKHAKGGDKPVVDPTTINNLLTFIQSRKDVNELLAFIMRQTGRKEIDPDTCKLLLRYLKGLSLDKATQLLGYVKWIHETLTSGDIGINRSKLNDVKSFSELVKLIAE
ncbi:hypothetical protein SUSAZ_10295 [Sulfolobus acidocaldarius SUSAZ]|nr:hypothetical protein SUSAZ_10295 [Sulfolobus acidocaldarius SUSAZ]